MRAALAEWTTLRVGGPADEMVFPETVEDAAAVVRRCAATGVPWRALGKGSNLLVDDAGVNGVVINTQKLRDISVSADGRVRAGAGLATSALMGRAIEHGLGGLECLVGYPATVGGAARMNAGGRWGETGARIDHVVAIDAAGEIVTLPASACAFGYRHSALGRMLVVEVGFLLPQVDVPAYRARIGEIQREKSAAQPLKEPSAGCVFRNPEGASAGRLIDQAGLKGRAVGGAMVSNVHGNFIVNRGGAAATDVLRLIDTMRDEVRRSSGVELRTEVEIWRRG